MISFIFGFLTLIVGFHLIMDFFCRKTNIHNRYPLLTVRLKRGEKPAIALLKYCTDHIVWGLKVVFILAISLFTRNPSPKSYGEMEAEKEANAQKMVDEYGGKLSDYL